MKIKNLGDAFKDLNNLGEINLKNMKIVTIDLLKEEVQKLSEIAINKEDLEKKYYAGYHEALKEILYILNFLNTSDINEEGE